MAKFIKTYELHLKDYVRFRTIDGQILCGTIQDISQFPDIFVEVGNPCLDNYNRYKISVNLIDEVFNDLFWQYDKIEFEQHEPLEFIYDEDLNEQIIVNYNEL